jgi:hypothetical protein
VLVRFSFGERGKSAGLRLRGFIPERQILAEGLAFLSLVKHAHLSFASKWFDAGPQS